MQRAILHQATFTGTHSRATRVLVNQVTGLDIEAVNDDAYQDVGSPLKQVLSVLANVVGGSLLLSGMFFLPHLIAWILG
ncbi:MAG: hypothetical protein GY732_05155 [Gammaproteobacteria bacterium]|nr:hypothetical protein [Gammaproteobacteria bacterium]